MARVTRRKFLKSSGVGALAVEASGMASILAAGKAPAYAQTTTVHWLKWNDFVPAGDQILRQSMLTEAEKALGFKINMETIGLNDLQPRATAAIQAQGGADIIMIFDNKAQLYADSCADVSAVCEAIGSSQGGYYDLAKANTHDGTKWIAVPYCIIGAMVAYRKSWFDEIGVTKFPETWEEYRAAGKKLKAKGRPLGQTFGHTVGDAPAFAYPYLWSWGGREVEADGKTVNLNTKETIESVKFLTAFWKDAHDEGGLAWDDSNNNRAFLSGTICATLNGASIYIEAQRKPDSYQTEKSKAMKDDIQHAPLPRGPAGPFSYHGAFSDVLLKYSKNQAAAKQFMRWMTSKEIFEKWFVSQQGFAVGCTTFWQNHPVWTKD